MNLITTISEKGQVTIPIAIRDLLGLEPFDKLVFTVEKEKIVAEAMKPNILALYGSVKPKNKKPVDLKKLRGKMVKEMAAKIALE